MLFRSTIDPKVELISIIQHVSIYGEDLGFLLNNSEFSYSRDMRTHFNEFKSHNAVQFFNSICLKPRMYNFTAPPTSMLYLDNCFKLRNDLLLDESLIKRIAGLDSFKIFIEYLRDFSKVSSFEDKFKSNVPYYKGLIFDVQKNLEHFDYVKELESFYGVKNKSYNLILVPLYGHVGYGPFLTMKNGEKHIYNIMGPQKVEEGKLIFGDEAYFKYLQLHEFSHSFVNPLTDKHWNLLEPYFSNFSNIPERARNNVCGDWQECINEHIVRSVTTYLAFQESQEIGQNALQSEKERGMIYLDALLEKIYEYEKQRTTYPTFESYYEILIEVFEK